MKLLLIVVFLCLCISTSAKVELSPKHTEIIVVENVPTSDKDIKCLAEVVYHEAGNQSIKGKIAVVSTVFNRMKKTNKTVCSIVYAKGQFAFTRKKHKKIDNDSWNKSLNLASSLLIDDNLVDNVNGATYFHNKNVKVSWSKHLIKVTTIGDHIFYRE
jgi:N-acetylmuramoyl-L-alanine amidase